MAEGLKGRFKHFDGNVSFDDYGDFTQYLSEQKNLTHSGSVSCNNCKQSISITNEKGRIDPQTGHAVIYCDDCKTELLKTLKEVST